MASNNTSLKPQVVPNSPVSSTELQQQQTVDAFNRNQEELRNDAEARALNTNQVDNTERLPKPDGAENENIKRESQEKVGEKISELELDQLRLAKAQEQTSLIVKAGTFILLFMFGILMILGIFALIFYGMDKLAEAFDFDISEYTVYLILLLTFCNLVMSCCGCFGTYMFSERYAKDYKELDRVSKSISRSAEEINNANEDMGDVFTRLEVEIMHFQGENAELIDSLKNIESAQNQFQELAAQSLGRAYTLRDLKLVWDQLETEKIIARITATTARFYEFAYLDGDRQPGLNEIQYEMLIQSSIIPKERRYFPDFNHPVWRKEEDENILIDEFERMLVLIYREILRWERQMKLLQERDDKESRQREDEEMKEILLAAKEELKEQDLAALRERESNRKDKPKGKLFANLF